MTVVRRVLIGVIGLLLLLDIAALALVKFGAGPKPSEEKSKLALWIDDEAMAKEALRIAEEKQYKAQIKPAKRETTVNSGYRVVMEGSRKILEPVANSLKRSGHQGLNFNAEGTELYYGGTYPDEAKAKKVAAKIDKAEKFVFDVKPGKKKVMVDSFKVIVFDVPQNLISDLTTPIEMEYTVEHIDEYPNEPVAEDSAEEETVDEEE